LHGHGLRVEGTGTARGDKVRFAKSTRAKLVPLHAAAEVTHLDSDRQLPVLRLRRVA